MTQRSTGSWFGAWLICGGLLLGGGVAEALDYQVRRGDTLSRIAGRFDVSVAAIQAANGLRDDMIFAGEILKIPVAAEAADDLVYVVERGDSLSAIAWEQGTTVAAIKRANGLAPGRRGDLIVPGQRLVIPGSGGSTSTSAGSTGGTTVTGGAARRPGEGWVQRDPMSASQTQLEVLARIVKGECPPSVPWEGKVAVAAVVLNRVRSRQFPNSIVRVAHQPRQFSCYNPSQRQRLYYGRIPTYAWEAARAALAGQDPTLGSTFYFNPYIVRPSWARSLEFVKRIGHNRINTHDFYRRPQDAPDPSEIITASSSDSRGLSGRLGLSLD